MKFSIKRRLQNQNRSSDHKRSNLIENRSAFRVLTLNYALIERLPAGSVFVDLGCGAGDVTKMLTYFDSCAEVGSVFLLGNRFFLIYLSHENSNFLWVHLHLSSIISCIT